MYLEKKIFFIRSYNLLISIKFLNQKIKVVILKFFILKLLNIIKLNVFTLVKVFEIYSLSIKF